MSEQNEIGAGKVSLVETRSAQVEDVDFDQRMITIIAVPYEEPATIMYRQEMWNEVFSRSAFQGIEKIRRSIPAIAALNVPDQGHNGTLIGCVVSANPNDPTGLIADIKVSKTKLGDDALALAADRALSASVGFQMKNRRTDETLDRNTRTRRINRAILDHLALVAQPAYSGAQVLAVRSDGSMSEADLPMISTPILNEQENAGIFQWTSSRKWRIDG